MLYYFVVPIHVLVSVVLILVVLLQTGKRADLAGAFGGGGSQTAFGARGASTFFSKMTTTCAVLFMVTSLALAILTTKSATERRSVLDEVQAPVTAPAEPGAAVPREGTSPGDQPSAPLSAPVEETDTGQPAPTEEPVEPSGDGS